MRDGPFAKLLLCSIAPCWLPGGLAACGLRDPKHEIPKQKREAIGQHPPLQQDITRRAMKGTDSLEAFHMGIHTQLNRGVHDGLNLAKQCLNSRPNSPKFRRCFVPKFTRSFEIPAGVFTMEFGATSGWDPQQTLIYLSFVISKSKFIQSVFSPPVCSGRVCLV